MSPYDVLVCGSGPGGVSAAVVAARSGLHVLLIEQSGTLGGYWTSGLMGISLDMPGKGGIPREIVDALCASGDAQWVDSASYTYDIEAMKLLLEQMVLDAKVDVLLYSRVTSVTMQGDAIASVHVDGPSVFDVHARWVIDGTGAGTIGSLAGCAFEQGVDGASVHQPASLEALVTGVPDSWKSDIHNVRRKEELFNLLQSVGVTASYTRPLLFKTSPSSDLFIFAVNHEFDIDCTDAVDMTKATLHARREIHQAVMALRTLPGWEHFCLAATAEQLALRDSRRIKGIKRITGEDLACGKAFPDGVVPCAFCVDVHALKRGDPEGKSPAGHASKPYQLPMGACIAADCKNLFMVGRCISGDFWANASYRVTCTASATGEAVAYAIASLGDRQDNGAVQGAFVKQTMRDHGYVLREA